MSTSTVLLFCACAALTLQQEQIPHNKSLSVASGPNKRIISGLAASKGQFPWQAFLEIKTSSGGYGCGGSLISALWVLTAAHCLENPIAVSVNLGIARLDDMSRSPVKANRVLIHPNYIKQVLLSDIALVGLSKSVSFSEFIRPIGLRSVPVGVGEQVTASGWGKTNDFSGVSYQLNYADLFIIRNEECAIFYGSFILTGGYLCAKGRVSQSPCSGDSGGPLILGSGSDAVLVGVISFVTPLSCSIGFPSGYTRLAPYIPWIVANVGTI